MLTPDEVNLKYWQSVGVDQVLTGVHLPGNELGEYLLPGQVVLDYGCGIGALASMVLDKNCSYLGADVNAEAIKLLKQNYPKANIILLDGTGRLDLANESVDVVLSSYVLVSIIDDTKVEVIFNEIKRVLKPGGIVWLAEATTSLDYKEQYELGKKILGKNNIAVSKGSDGEVKRYIRHYTKEELINLLYPLRAVYQEQTTHTSPSSGKSINTLVTIFKK